MKIIKIITLQLFWYLAVLGGSEYQNITLTSAIAICTLNFYLFKPSVTIGHYLFTLIFFVFYGFAQEFSLQEFGLVNYNQNSTPLWLLSLYIVFLAYYGDIFNYLSNKSKSLLFFIGSFGGVAAYYGGSKISSLEILSPYYLIAIAISWGAFFILSFKVFYGGYMWNKILDATIYFSFDKSGYLRHAKKFNSKLIFKQNAHALITGGTSGIGKTVAQELAKQKVNVITTGRNKENGESSCKGHEFIRFIKWDMANWQEIDRIVNSIEPLEYIVLNAGGMPPRYQQNEQGVELQFASQLFGHYYLIKKLKEKDKLIKNAKIVWVTSGGMYLSKLKLETILKNEKYDKVATYANVKRAQVTLLPFLKEEFPNQIVSSMHPGWVETPGVRSAIPEFEKKMKGRLRTPLQGADTILWLLSHDHNENKSGELYFDRVRVKRHLFWFTKKSDNELQALIQQLNKFNLKGNTK